jgi:hypothetical protein
VPRRIRHGKRIRLRLTLSAPAPLKFVVQRRVRGHRIRVRTRNVDGRPRVDPPSRRVDGHALKRGRYRVSVVVIDAAGNRSATVRRPLRSKRAR